MKNHSITATRRLETMDRARRPAKDLKNRFCPKVMLCVWWNFEGVIHWGFVPNGCVVDADLYSQQMERVHEILRWSSLTAGLHEQP